MAPRRLDAEVTRNGRRVEGSAFALTADPGDYGVLRDALRDWLAGSKWDRKLWGQFELVIRYAGEWKIRKTVRAV
jgi:hypothetical protein